MKSAFNLFTPADEFNIINLLTGQSNQHKVLKVGYLCDACSLHHELSQAYAHTEGNNERSQGSLRANMLSQISPLKSEVHGSSILVLAL